jgi:DNA binding protein with HTH domain
MFNDLVQAPDFKLGPGMPPRLAVPYATNVFSMPVRLARLDERLAGAPASVRTGWIKRALVYEAVASLRPNGAYVSAHDLVLRLNDTLDRAPDEDIARAKDIHGMLSTLIRRNPQHLFNPRRILALTRLRLQNRVVDHPDLPDWLQSRMRSPQEMRDALEDALQPSVVSAWESLPPLHAAAEIIANWHKSRAADCIGAAAGRALAMAWLYRGGLTTSYCFLPSIGFLGAALEYRPDLRVSWGGMFMKACGRVAEWGFKLHSHLTLAHRRLHEAAPQRRSRSHMAAMIDLLVSTPAVSAGAASRALRITSTAARAMLNALEDRGLVREVTERGSFRLYAAASLDLAA